MALSIKTKTLVALFHSGLVKESSTVDNKGHRLNMTGNNTLLTVTVSTNRRIVRFLLQWVYNISQNQKRIALLLECLVCHVWLSVTRHTPGMPKQALSQLLSVSEARGRAFVRFSRKSGYTDFD